MEKEIMNETDKHIFFRSAGEINPTIDRAEGIYCYDDDGKRYIDGMGGVAVVTIGHQVKEIQDAAIRQMDKICFAHPFHWKNRPHMELTRNIAKLAPQGMSMVFMTSGGSEATESALKMVRQFYVERGMPSRYKVISRRISFHGNTIGALSMTRMLSRREAFAPLLLDFPQIQACNCYRCPFKKKYPDCNIQCAHELESVIQREGQESIAAFIAEPVVGAAGGALTPPPEYFPIIREICDRYDILMIVDEVITGFGRIGQNFGIDYWGVIPDIICTGKGMSSGYSPLGAVIVHNKVYQVFEESSKGFSHGHTFGGNPLSCAIGNAVLEYTEKHQLIQNVKKLSSHFFHKAEELAELDIVGEIRGKGFFMGMEFVKDKTTKEPFAPEMNISGKIADIAFSKGLITGANKGGIDGILGEHINLAPPFICSKSDLDEIIDIMKESIVEFQKSL
jgi:adenosylmethionine-8-amino-7-oxononanoate aminotransferase